MTYVFRIKGAQDLAKVDNLFRNLNTNIPKIVSQAMMSYGSVLERSLKMSAESAGIEGHSNTGLFGSGIEWRQNPNGRVGKLFIRQYGLYLDSMKPHAVAITRRRTRLLKWARSAKNSSIRRSAELVSSGGQNRAIIFVRPHPFIEKGLRRARPKLRKNLQQEFNKFFVKNV